MGGTDRGQTEVRAFGSLTVRSDRGLLGSRDFGGVKPKQLLERLILSRGSFVSNHALTTALWPARSPDNVAGALQTYVSVLRRAMFADRDLARRVLVTGPGGYRVAREELSLDLDSFDDVLRRAERAHRSERRVLLQRAVTIAAGDLFEDEPYLEWIHDQREMYRATVTRSHLLIASEALADAPLLAVRHGEAALMVSPLAEEAFRVIMLANYALGHTELARHAFVRCRDALDRELGVDPTTKTIELAAAIDAGTPPQEVFPRIDAAAANVQEHPWRERRNGDRRRHHAPSA